MVFAFTCPLYQLLPPFYLLIPGLGTCHFSDANPGFLQLEIDIALLLASPNNPPSRLPKHICGVRCNKSTPSQCVELSKTRRTEFTDT